MIVWKSTPAPAPSTVAQAERLSTGAARADQVIIYWDTIDEVARESDGAIFHKRELSSKRSIDQVRDDIYDLTSGKGSDPGRLKQLFEEFEQMAGKPHPLRRMYSSWILRNCKFAQ